MSVYLPGERYAKEAKLFGAIAYHNERKCREGKRCMALVNGDFLTEKKFMRNYVHEVMHCVLLRLFPKDISLQWAFDCVFGHARIANGILVPHRGDRRFNRFGKHIEAIKKGFPTIGTMKRYMQNREIVPV